MDIQWPLVVFSLFAGAGGALFAFIGISEIVGIAKRTRVIAAICVLVLLIIGGCASVLHLGQPANIMAAATNIFSFSGISVELIMLGINVVLAAIYLVLARREGSEGSAKVVGIIGIVTGVVMAFVVGNGYVMQAQPNWNNLALPFSYLGSGLACGGTLFASLMVVKGEDAAELKKIVMYVLIGLAIQTVAFIIYAAMIGFQVVGPVFWGGAFVVGCVAAIVCVYLINKMPSLAYGALACAVVGGIAFRALMWMIGAGYLNLFSDAAAHSILGL